MALFLEQTSDRTYLVTWISPKSLISLGLDAKYATQLCADLNSLLINCATPTQSWSEIATLLCKAKAPFAIHLFLFKYCYPHWQSEPEHAPAYLPNEALIQTSNLYQLMQQIAAPSVAEFHQWSVKAYEAFWQCMINTLNIQFYKSPTAICDLSKGVTQPTWLPNAKMNIVQSCFQASPDAIALIEVNTAHTQHRTTYGELQQLVKCIAHSLNQQGYKAGDAIAIAMPMNHFAVAIYLGIISIGGIVVSIADSFSKEEMATRLQIAKAKALFTQDFIPWGEKQIPLYEKLASLPLNIIVLCQNPATKIQLRSNAIAWQTFFRADESFTYVSCEPMQACNILFSSGTTATPKAIVWNHTTAIKAASDAYLHQNIQVGDVLAWPTNLGWMMGPWLIFAALINRASIALYTDSPRERAFGEFVVATKVTMLGVIPTLVALWRQSQCMEGLDFSAIKVFSSTGECSNAEDMLYLMSLAHYRPVIEYCGGTEIGGAYLSSTVLQPNCPALFSTIAMGSNICLLDENGEQAQQGEVAIIPPTIGLSTELLNANHEEIYFANMPRIGDIILRRHGDEAKRYANGYYSILGRVDDAMNLSGIKISAAEIERAIKHVEDVREVAAVAVQVNGQRISQLIIFTVLNEDKPVSILKTQFQAQINQHLNPLFKIADVIIVNELPKTASHKIMRRKLREMYLG